MHEMIVRAESFVDSEIGPDRIKASDYYHAKPFGNEEKGRSHVVSPDVHDAIIGIMPDLVNVFLGPENVVEFVPNGPEDVEMAEQATDYINQVVLSIDNPGFRVLYDALLDANVRKTGILKRFWEEKEVKRSTRMTGVDPAQLQQLESDPRVTYKVTAQRVQLLPDMTEIPVFDCDITFTETEGRLRVQAVPPEEFLISPGARCLKTADYVGHRRKMSIADIVALGYDEDTIREGAGSQSAGLELNQEERSRYPEHWGSPVLEDRAQGKDEATLYESTVRLPEGGYRYFLSVGNSSKNAILEEYDVEERDFAILCPRPEPHSAIGYSLADDTGWIQLVKSMTLRASLDSFVQAIFPDTIVAEDRMVDMDDVLDTGPGRVIRVRGGDTNVVRTMVTPMIANEALPLLAYFDAAREETTGVSRAANGLDPDALQSSTKKAVDATVDARQKQVKMLAMIFAHDLAEFIKGIARMLIKHQDRGRMVRLRGKWVEVNPKFWDAEMDVQVNLGVGPGTIDSRKAVVAAMMADQRNLMDKYGLASPLFHLPTHRKLIAKWLEMEGFKNSDQFYPPVPDNWQPPPPQPPPPDPALEVQREAIQAEAQISLNKLKFETAKLQFESAKLALENDMQRDKAEGELYLKAREQSLKYGVPLDLAELTRIIEHQRGFNGSLQ